MSNQQYRKMRRSQYPDEDTSGWGEYARNKAEWKASNVANKRLSELAQQGYDEYDRNGLDPKATMDAALKSGYSLFPNPNVTNQGLSALAQQGYDEYDRNGLDPKATMDAALKRGYSLFGGRRRGRFTKSRKMRKSRRMRSTRRARKSRRARK